MRLLRTVFLCLPAMFILIAANAASGLDLYVATDGNDAWSGGLPAPNASRTDGPFATLQRARDAIRAVKVDKGLHEPVTVNVRGGEYFLAEPLVLTSQDSGSADASITYAAYANERPVISGGRRITGWKQAKQGVWQADVPEVKNGQWYFRQLWINGDWRQRPRKPDDGLLPVVDKNTEEKDAFYYRPGDFQESWARGRDVELVMLQHWMVARLFVKDIDASQDKLTVTGGSWRDLSWANGYYFDNVFDAFGKPGQWYLDRANGVVLYVPREGERLDSIDAVAPSLEQLVRLEGEPEKDQYIEHVGFRGLRFAHTAWQMPERGYAFPQAELPVLAMFYAKGAHRCIVEDCEFSNADSTGIDLSAGCVENQIVRNAIHDLGAGGIKISNGSEVRASYDDAPSKKKGKEWEGLGNPRNDAHGNVVSDNTVKDGAKTYMGAVGVWVGHSSGNQIAHNEISGPWQFAVSVGWNWHYTPPSLARDNVIEYNHVHHIGGLLKSHSTLYTLGIQPGTVLQYNVVHDSSGYGLAFDECSTCILAENNLVYRQAAGGLHFNRNCLGNIVQNNIFALNGDAKQGQLTRYGDQPLGKEDTNCNVFMRNIVYWHDSRLWNEKRWSNDRVIHDFNLYWDTSGKPIEPLGLSWEEWTKKSPTFGFHIDSHSIIGDPLFVDPQNDDFRLQAESPASQIGFRPFDLSTVGPRGKTPSK